MKAKLEALSTPDLVDRHGAAERRAKTLAAKAKPAAPKAKKKVVRSKKAQAKAAAKK
jgi:hypothetical protein